MPNLADCVTKLSAGKGRKMLSVRTPKANDLKGVLNSKVQINSVTENGFKLGGMPSVALEQQMLCMGAVQRPTALDKQDKIVADYLRQVAVSGQYKSVMVS